MPAALYSFGTLAWAAVAAVAVTGGFNLSPMHFQQSSGPCEFDTIGTQMRLKRNCTTNETILIPDGYTLDGRNRSITAVDPSGDHFRGGVVENAGSVAHVRNLTIVASGLTDVCDAGDDRLRGVKFEGASGSIKYVKIAGLNQGSSGCQEGNGIEVRNAPFDGTHPATKGVEVMHNKVTGYQKTGIVVNGDVRAVVRFNDVSESATQQALAANGVQFGFGSFGEVQGNKVGGNQWCGPSDFAGTAFLFFQTGGNIKAETNITTDNADLGMYVFGDNISVKKNIVTDEKKTADCNQFDYDIGIGNYGSNNIVEKNVIKGFDLAIDGPTTGNNVTLRAMAAPSPVVTPFE
jgi:hypothetical protein